MAKLKKGTTIDGVDVLDNFIKNNLNADRPPNKDDDETEGYEKASVWFYKDESTSKTKSYICLSNEESGAIWKVFASGVLPEGIFYDEGLEPLDLGEWIEAEVIGENENTNFEKRETEMFISAESVAEDTGIAIAFSKKIDFSKINNLYIDWEGEGSTGTASARTRFQLTDSLEVGGFLIDEANVQNTFNFSRQVESIDTSGINGEYYIRINVGITSTDTNGSVTVYRVWSD